MTDALELYVKWAKVDKQYAWWAAKNLASIAPHLYADLPARLTEVMREANLRDAEGQVERARGD